MADVKAKLQDALKQAMISKDAARRDPLRLMMSAIKQVEVDERRTLTDDETLALLQREVKKRRESIDEARKAGRGDIAEEEIAEVAIIEEFLPQQLSRAEIEALAREAVQQTGATGAKDMGKVMGVLMPKVRGVADGKLVNEVVRDLLSS